jgi:hypothetical protein
MTGRVSSERTKVPPSPSPSVKSGATARASVTVDVEVEVKDDVDEDDEEPSVDCGRLAVPPPEVAGSPQPARKRAATTARAAVLLITRGYKSPAPRSFWRDRMVP